MPPQSNQVTLPFDTLTEKGLKPVVKKFEKLGCHVVEVDAPNKPKRESGFQVKQFTLTIEDGQKVSVKIKAGGAVYQVKLNNKVIPIKHLDDVDKAIGEIVEHVQSNASAYAKSKMQAAKRKLKPKKPHVTTTRKEKLASVLEDLSLITQNIADMETELKGIQDEIEEYRADLTKAEEDLADEIARNATLTAQIDALQKEQSQAA